MKLIRCLIFVKSECGPVYVANWNTYDVGNVFHVKSGIANSMKKVLYLPYITYIDLTWVLSLPCFAYANTFCKESE